jgi:hypothetical protein
MHLKQPWLSLLIGFAAALAVAASSAAGLGAGSAAAVLGQPLDFAVNVRLDVGETLGPECMAAEVTAGDRRIPPALVRTVVETTSAETARVRVLTQPSMDEPVIGIELSVGCASRISRRYVVLADPPMSQSAATAPSFAAKPTPVSEGAAPAAPSARADTAASQVPGESASGRPGASAARTAAAAARASRPVIRTPLDPAEAERRAQRRAERRAVAKAAKEAKAAARLANASQPGSDQAVAAVSGSRSTIPPRLKLEVEEPAAQSSGKAAVEEALAAVAQAASAARAAASAASASSERVAGLERTVEQLRAEAQASRELAAQFRQRLTAAEGSSVWLLPLLVGVGLLAVLCGWLAWRLGQVQNQRQQVWREAAAAPAVVVPEPVTEATPSRQPTSPIPFVTSELRPAAPAAPVSRPRPTHAWPPPAPPVAWPPPDSTIDDVDTHAQVPLNERTEPMPAVMGSAQDVARDVTIEELIDLEQQAEFFIVLGQEDAAVELLVEHLRSSGGGSPLPYLKLLEIHHRRNDRDAYERMRTRFNHRFNAYAPEWGVDLGTGRTLDDYAAVIPSMQAVWPRPLDAMAELEALLFRKSSGELFDLPAYREVLFLYSLARDLLDRGAADNGNVDLLLPMGSGTNVGTAARSPAAGLDRDAFRDTQINEDRTETLDFDVSASDRRTSIFDLLDEKPHTRPP